MTKRYVDVYEDANDVGGTVGIRDDGAVDVMRGGNLELWRAGASAFDWVPKEHEFAREWSRGRSELLGRIEYDDEPLERAS